MSRPRRHGLGAPWLLPLGLAVLALGHVVTNDFAWDDAQYVLRNEAIQSPREWPRLLGLRYWSKEQPTMLRSYRPVREVSLAVDYALWGPRPCGYHLTSVLAHGVVVVAVYGLVRAFAPVGAAALAASVFAIHPAQVEVIATVENRAEIFAACFVLAALACWVRAVRRGRWAWVGLAAAALAMGLMSKVVAAALPLALAAAACCLPGLCGRRKFAAASVGALFALAAAFVLADMALVSREPTPLVALGQLGWAWRPAVALRTWHDYLGMALLPWHSHADRLFVVPGPPLWAWYVGLAAWVAAGAALWRWRGAVVFGAAWFTIFLLPVLNLAPIEGRPLAEQRLYLPLAGLSLSVAAGLARTRARRAWLMVGLVACATLSGRQVFAWANNRTLWFDNVVHSPGNARSRNNLGMQYAVVRAYGLAKAQLAAAFRLDPADTTAARNMASVLTREGLLDRAVEWLHRALRVQPEDADTWVELGGVQARRSRWRAAEEALTRAIELDPRKVTAYDSLAGVCMAQGRHSEAEAVLRKALRVSPNHAATLANLGQVYAHLGRRKLALDACRRAVAANPRSSLVRVRLGEVCFRLGRFKSARQAFTDALRLDPANPQAAAGLERVRAALAFGRGGRP